jgi:hypothetical protein
MPEGKRHDDYLAVVTLKSVLRLFSIFSTGRFIVQIRAA